MCSAQDWELATILTTCRSLLCHRSSSSINLYTDPSFLLWLSVVDFVHIIWLLSLFLSFSTLYMNRFSLVLNCFWSLSIAMGPSIILGPIAVLSMVIHWRNLSSFTVEPSDNLVKIKITTAIRHVFTYDKSKNCLCVYRKLNLAYVLTEPKLI